MYRLGRVKVVSACRDFVVCTVAYYASLSIRLERHQDKTNSCVHLNVIDKKTKKQKQKKNYIYIFVSLYPRYLGDLTSIHYSVGMVHFGESSLYDAQ